MQVREFPPRGILTHWPPFWLCRRNYGRYQNTNYRAQYRPIELPLCKILEKSLHTFLQQTRVCGICARMPHLTLPGVPLVSFGLSFHSPAFRPVLLWQVFHGLIDLLLKRCRAHGINCLGFLDFLLVSSPPRSGARRTFPLRDSAGESRVLHQPLEICCLPLKGFSGSGPR